MLKSEFCVKDGDVMYLITEEADIEALRNKITQSIDLTVQKIRSRQESGSAIESMFELRFHKLGYDPIELTPLNFVEQLNQTFSDLVALEGVRYLLRHYPGTTFKLHLGTESGFDIESDDGMIIAECFAVTTVKSNEKLAKDSKKLMKCDTCSKRYIFLYTQFDSEDYLEKRYTAYPGVCCVRVDSLY